MATTPVNHRAPLTGSRTDEGYTKKPNEDAWDLFKIGSQPWDKDPAAAVYVGIVADGVTSKAGGEQASRLAVKTIKKVLQSQPLPRAFTGLQPIVDDAIQQANREILEMARQNPQWGNMSTTLVLALIANGQLCVAHLGDSRAYLIRQGEIYRLTLDHTWIQEALDLQRITPAEARAHPNRNVIRRYLGINASIDIDWQMIHPRHGASDVEQRQYTTTVTLQADDVVLLCSDGLTEKVTDGEIVTVINGHKSDPQKAAALLIKRALAKKEQDNITVALLSFASRSGWRQWGNWIWLPFFVLLGIFVVGLYSYLGNGFLSNVPGASALPATSAPATATLSPTVTAAETPTAPPVPATPAGSISQAIGSQPPTATIKASATPPLGPTPTRQTPPTPTREPTTPPTVTPLPTATAGATPQPSPAATQRPANPATDAGVTLTLPAEGDTSTGATTFAFTTGYPLQPGEGFEVVVWRAGVDVLMGGYGVAAPIVETSENGLYRVAGNLSTVRIDQNDTPLPGATYQWGVLLVRPETADNPYQRLAYLGGQRSLVYNPGAGDSDGGGRDDDDSSCVGAGCSREGG